MAKNDYLARKAIENQAYFEAELQMGRQQIIDLVSLCLRDPKIVDKDIFGKGRLLKIVKGLGDYIDLYQPAWEKRTKQIITEQNWMQHWLKHMEKNCTTHSINGMNIVAITITRRGNGNEKNRNS